MDKKPAQKPTGRPVSDDRGNATWEFDGELDTARLKALTDGMAIEEATSREVQPRSPGRDPYDKRAGAEVLPPEAPSKPRTLDDMRRLSEEIKRTRKDKKS